ncbi:MAG TPA: hypothetical protein VGI81_05480 [Tepidisphaeraceae bacterium]
MVVRCDAIATEDAMVKKRKSAIEAFLALSPEEKEREFRSLDREFSRDETRPLNAEERKRWKKFLNRTRPRRPKMKPEIKRVSFAIELGLLKQVDRLARRAGLTRSQLMARGLEMLLRTS